MAEISDDRIRVLAREILARPEFAAAHPSAVESWLVSLIDRLLDWISGFGSLRISAPVLFWVIFGALVVIFVFMVAQIVWSISAAMRAPEPRADYDSSGPAGDPAAEAAQQAAAGNFLEAAHCLMIASFRTLAERSVIDLRPDRSNLWIRRALRDSKLNGELVRELDRLIARTERYWFGDRENSPVIYSQWRSVFDQLSRAVG
ncbi:MAG TPA: hypothetical protein VEC38_08030 [Candidatus Binataceae bacterium]|nr:hypothetical protein [Candidatus Binataceae bacterium]